MRFAEIEAAGGQGLAVPGEATSEEDAESSAHRRRALRPDRHLRRHGDGDRLRRGRAARGRGAAPRAGRQLPRPRTCLPGRAAAPEGKPRHVHRRQLLPCVPRIPLQAADRASKAAARAFFESARVELEKEQAGVDLSLVLPGAINTPQFDRGRQKLGFQPLPVPPIYQPDLVAAAVPPLLRSGRSASCR